VKKGVGGANYAGAAISTTAPIMTLTCVNVATQVRLTGYVSAKSDGRKMVVMMG